MTTESVSKEAVSNTVKETPKEFVIKTPVVETKITSDVKVPKLKDPKKVPQVKKLAEISKQAKERKTREAIQQEMLEDKEGNWNIPYGYIIGTIGLSIVAGALYYGYDPHKIVKPTPTPTTMPPVKSNLDSFD